MKKSMLFLLSAVILPKILYSSQTGLQLEIGRESLSLSRELEGLSVNYKENAFEVCYNGEYYPIEYYDVDKSLQGVSSDKLKQFLDRGGRIAVRKLSEGFKIYMVIPINCSAS